MLFELHRDSIQNSVPGTVAQRYLTGPVQSYAPPNDSIDIENGVAVALLE